MLDLISTPLLEVLIVSAFLSMFISGLLIIGEKVGLKDFFLLYSPNKFFYKMFGCAFCVSHHLSAIFISGLLFIEFDFWFLFVPLLTATMTNKIK